MRIPAAVLLASLVPFSLFADSPVSAVAAVPATGVQRAPSVAVTTQTAFAAWEDGRAHIRDREVVNIYGVPLGIEAAPSALDQPLETDDGAYAPQVIYDGQDFVVISEVAAGFRFARVHGTTHRISFSDLGITALRDHQLAVAWNGSRFCLIYNTPDGIRGVVTSADGAIVKTLTITAPGRDDVHPNVASDGHTFAVAWISRSDANAEEVRVAEVSGDGEVTPRGTLTSFNARPAEREARPGLAWDAVNARYLAVWSSGEVRAQFLAHDATPIGTTSIYVFASGRQPVVATDGTTFLIPFVVDGQGDDIYTVRLTLLGDLLDQQPQAITAAVFNQNQPQVAAFGPRFLLVWNDNGDIRSGLFDARFNNRGPQSVLSLGPGTQTSARAAFDGTNLGFVWTEDGRVVFGRTTLDGRPLDGGGIDTFGLGTNPRIVFGDNVYYVTWTNAAPYQRGNTIVRRYSADGQSLDQFPIYVPFSDNAAIATDGHSLLAIESDGQQLRAVTIPADGLLGIGDAIADPVAFLFNPRVAWNGSQYIVVYGSNNETRVALFDRSGHERGVPAFVANTAAAQTAKLASAGDGTSLLIGSTIWKLSVDGLPLTKRTLACSACIVTDAVWSGSDYVVLVDGAVVHLDRDGAELARSPLVLDPATSTPTLARAGDRIALAYDRPELVLPGIHEGTVRRSFFTFLPEVRRRGVIRR